MTQYSLKIMPYTQQNSIPITLVPNTLTIVNNELLFPAFANSFTVVVPRSSVGSVFVWAWDGNGAIPTVDNVKDKGIEVVPGGQPYQDIISRSKGRAPNLLIVSNAAATCEVLTGWGSN